MTETVRLGAGAEAIAEAARWVRDGALVAFPTETVYGLGADARNARAVAEIYAAKGRPRFNPLILHAASLDMARRYAAFNDTAEMLATRFWPGPLTLVLPRIESAGLAELVSAGLPTVALRVPDHEGARRLISMVGGPVAAPSANPSGMVSPTTAAHVLEGLGGRIAAVIDDGRCAIGLESTIVAFEEGKPVLLRAGGITAEALGQALGQALGPPGAPGEAGRITAPGQLARHYAPGVRLRLDATEPRVGEGWLGFGAVPHGVTGPALSLSPEGDLVEAAANLFAHLRALDQAMGGHGIVAVAQIPEHGLGRAINDRLRRAAAPRTETTGRARH